MNEQSVTSRISCPECGNDIDFFEIADGVIITTHYRQNPDGSFTPEDDDSQILGNVKLICAECESDLTAFHQRFTDMLF